MIFSSLGFIFVFLPFVFVIYQLLSLVNHNFLKNIWLVISSLFFYYLGHERDLWWLLSSVIVNYIFAYCIDYTEKRINGYRSISPEELYGLNCLDYPINQLLRR